MKRWLLIPLGVFSISVWSMSAQSSTPPRERPTQSPANRTTAPPSQCSNLRQRPAWLKPDVPKVSAALKDEVRKTLKWGKHYKTSHGAVVSWLKKLRTGSLAQRQTLAQKLLATLVVALEDEHSGRSPWLATPFWGSSSVNRAREIRQAILNHLSTANYGSETLPLLRFFLEHDPLYQVKKGAIQALRRVRGKAADAYILALIKRPYPFAPVIQGALQEAQTRRLKLQVNDVQPLLHYHRKAIRAAARALIPPSQRSRISPFRPVDALQHPRIASYLAQIGQLRRIQIPANAPFVTATQESWTIRDGKKTTKSKRDYMRGFLLHETPKEYVIFTPFGWRETLSKRHSEVYTFQKRKVVYGTNYTIQKIPLAAEVRRVESLRKSGDPKYQLSRSGGLTGQFQGRGASIYELLFGQWLAQTKRWDFAARILLPAIETLLTDESAVRLVQHATGRITGYAMLRAFVGDRNYPKTLRLARRMQDCHPHHPLTRIALRLQRELPQRGDDFKTLTLPTLAQWELLRKRLTHPEQIRYLLKRLRLLTGFQMGQPGGVDFLSLQSTGPCTLSRNASWGSCSGKTTLINPLAILLGRGSSFRPPPKKTPFLTRKDIPLLLQEMRKEWTLLAVGFWRDFHPSRHTYTTYTLLCWILGDIAKSTICRPYELHGKTGAALTKAFALIEQRLKHPKPRQ